MTDATDATDANVDLVTPLTTAESAEKWLHAVYAKYGPWHPDDRAAELIKFTPGEHGDRTPVFDPATAVLVDARMDEVFALHVDPYAIVYALLEANGTFK